MIMYIDLLGKLLNKGKKREEHKVSNKLIKIICSLVITYCNPKISINNQINPIITKSY